MDVLATLDSRLHFKTADLNGIQYRYIHAEPDSGKSVGTVFLVHGWPDLALGWANHIPFLLSKGLSVVALDKIGYGGTDSPEDVKFYTWKRAADDIATLASQLGLSRIILGGHDFGGAVVYRTAIWHPDLVAAFYVLNTPFAAPTASFVDLAYEWPGFKYQQQFRTDAVADYVGPADAQNTTRIRQILNNVYGVIAPNGEQPSNVTDIGFYFDLLDLVTTDTPLLTKAQIDFYVEEYTRKPINHTLNEYRNNKLNWEDERVLIPDNTTYSGKFKQPALYIAATQDLTLPPSLSEGMETYFDNLSRGEIDGGHWARWQKPLEVENYVGNWLETSVLGNASLNLTAGLGLGAPCV